jgi:hypothetical protein
LTGNDRLSPIEQLEIYRRQFWLRHTTSLVEDYPGLSGILGQRAWEVLVEAYLSEVAPSSWTLRDLGESLAGYVERRIDTPHHALCLDMARLEWAYTELFDAADSGSLDPAKLAAIPDDAWGAVRMTMSPALRLLRTQYPVARLRRELREAALGIGDGDSSKTTEVPPPKQQNLALYRDRERVLRYSVLSEVQMVLLEGLVDGEPLDKACSLAGRVIPNATSEIEANIGGWFAEWGKRRWIVDVDL